MGGALCTLFQNKPVKVLYFGLDTAGKTTLLYRLKLGEVVTTIPTIGFNVETVNRNGVHMATWDIGTRDRSRSLYRFYLDLTDAVIFVVDSTDRDRLKEAVDEFFSLIVPHAEETQGPVLVLANKQDVAGAMTPEMVREAITRKRHLRTDMEVFPTTALTLHGVDAALDWLTSKLAVKIARESWLSSASLGKMVQYPASLVKSSYLKVSGVFAPGDHGESGVSSAKT